MSASRWRSGRSRSRRSSTGIFRLDGGAMFGVVPAAVGEGRAARRPQPHPAGDARVAVVRGGGRTILIDAGTGGKLDAKAADIYGFDGVPSLDARWRRPASAPTTSTSYRLAPALRSRRRLHRRATPTAACGRAFPTRGTVVRRGEWDDALAPARAEPSQLLRRKLRAACRRPASSSWSTTTARSCQACACGGPAGTRSTTRSSRSRTAADTAIFAADLLPTAAHVPLPYIMGYDLYPMDTLAFKRGFLRGGGGAGVSDTVRARPGDRGRRHPGARTGSCGSSGCSRSRQPRRHDDTKARRTSGSHSERCDSCHRGFVSS